MYTLERGDRLEAEGLEEADAITALRMGDMRGLETLVSRHLARARRVASVITLDRDEGEDIAHVAFIRAVSAIMGFDPTKAFWPWFRRIVVNEALRTVRSRRRFVDGVELEELPSCDRGPGAADPAARLETTELRRLLDEALAGLDHRDRAVLVLHYYEDRSLEVMAMKLGWPMGTVKARLSRARRRLRERIERGPLAHVVETSGACRELTSSPAGVRGQAGGA